jgi:hypothetical protein
VGKEEIMAVKVVLDTNCVVSALLFSKQNFAWLRHAWQSGTITPIVDKATTAELMRVLHYPKFKLTQDEQHTLLADFLPYAQVVTNTEIAPNLPKIRDPNDQIFLNLAVVSSAAALVTGDLDLLEIKHSFNTPPIMTLSEFQSWLGEAKQK